MKFILPAIVILGLASPTLGCPELTVPLNPTDPVLKSRAWKKALKHFRKKQYAKAHSTIRKQSKSLEAQVNRLFGAAPGKEPSNKKIQQWLQKNVYTRNAGVLIQKEKFTYPTLIWWVWSDVACRAKKYNEAATALEKLREIRPGNDQRHYEALIQIRLGNVKKAQDHLRVAPPDGFITPFIKGLVAMKNGKKSQARQFLLAAKAAAIVEERQQAVDAELEKLKDG